MARSTRKQPSQLQTQLLGAGPSKSQPSRCVNSEEEEKEEMDKDSDVESDEDGGDDEHVSIRYTITWSMAKHVSR